MFTVYYEHYDYDPTDIYSGDWVENWVQFETLDSATEFIQSRQSNDNYAAAQLVNNYGALPGPTFRVAEGVL